GETAVLAGESWGKMGGDQAHGLRPVGNACHHAAELGRQLSLTPASCGLSSRDDQMARLDAIGCTPLVSGCAALISGTGVDPNKLTTKDEVHAKFGQPRN